MKNKSKLLSRFKRSIDAEREAKDREEREKIEAAERAVRRREETLAARRQLLRDLAEFATELEVLEVTKAAESLTLGFEGAKLTLRLSAEGPGVVDLEFEGKQDSDRLYYEDESWTLACGARLVPLHDDGLVLLMVDVLKMPDPQPVEEPAPAPAPKTRRAAPRSGSKPRLHQESSYGEAKLVYKAPEREMTYEEFEEDDADAPVVSRRASVIGTKPDGRARGNAPATTPGGAVRDLNDLWS